MQIKFLGRREHGDVEAAMRSFTAARTAATPDELWLCEHHPVFTLGVAGRGEHVLDAAGIAVVRTGRGGQVTYHGPGQVVAYPLVDLRRLRIYVKEYVYRLERAALDVLASYDLTGHRIAGAPGVFVRLDEPSGHRRLEGAGGDRFAGMGKVAALGIKVSNHCTYHGLALNVAMDLRPFSRIHPCGYAGLATVDLATLGVHAGWDDVAQRLGARLSILLAA
ncbi:MAG TPA: lipoyl(octanoyl) transferase LipB [Burkholderiaceae bacterium]|nr:lipoyl(octanoyl) transferase LipB [Burkholderiaceae bacterium]